eukprot:59752-Prorocentrum_minimum.AAC.2
MHMQFPGRFRMYTSKSSGIDRTAGGTNDSYTVARTVYQPGTRCDSSPIPPRATHLQVRCITARAVIADGTYGGDQTCTGAHETSACALDYDRPVPIGCPDSAYLIALELPLFCWCTGGERTTSRLKEEVMVAILQGSLSLNTSERSRGKVAHTMV